MTAPSSSANVERSNHDIEPEPWLRSDLLANRQFSTALNWLRGLSALEVMLDHVRNNMFLVYRDLNNPSAAVKVFYIFTGLGPEAVICFFVLSGLLVGGKCLKEFSHNIFSPPIYVIDRMSRIYMVFVPALALTVGLFYFQRWLGAPEAICSSSTLSWSLLLGNLLQLQNVVVPPPCNNNALWSLANEMWYYAIAPVAFALVFWPRQRVRAGLILCMMIIFLSVYWRYDRHGILLYLPIWALGLVCWLRFPAKWSPILPATALAVSLLLSRLHVFSDGWFYIGDSLIAVSLVLLLVALASRPASEPGRLSKVATGAANISFSLYVVHRPIMEFMLPVLASYGAVNFPLSPYAPLSYALLGEVIAACLFVAVLFYWAFERHTMTVKHAIYRAMRV